MNFYNIQNSNTHSQTGVWEQGRSPVGCDCYRTICLIFKTKFQFFFMPIFGAMAIAPYKFLLNQKSQSLTDQFKKGQIDTIKMESFNDK